VKRYASDATRRMSNSSKGDFMGYKIKAKVISSKGLTTECQPIQTWGLPYCRTCDYLATEDCGGYRLRKGILAGKYPKEGLPDRRDSYAI
jgi:hypothetical protein